MDPEKILWEAVRTNDAATVNLLLKHSFEDCNNSCMKSSVLDFRHQGLCPIHLAVLNGNITLFTLLLESGAALRDFEPGHVSDFLESAKKETNFLNESDYQNLPLLCLPIFVDERNMFLKILEHDPSILCDLEGKALGFACRIGKVEYVHSLIHAGHSRYMSRCDNFEKSWSQSLLLSALMIPGQSEQLNIIKLLLEMDLSVSDKDSSGSTPLHVAAQSGNVEVVELIIEKLQERQEPICVENSNLRSPLQIACNKGHLEVVKVLVEHQCNRRCSPEGRKYLLHAAAKASHVKVVQYLVGKGENVNQLDSFANTPLSQAVVKANNIEIAKVLLAAGANPNIPQPPYHSIIISAAQKGSLEMVTALLENNANPNSVDILGYAPISYASARRDSPQDFIHVLVEHGANVDHEHGNGSTSLHRAVKDDNLPSVTSLIQHGADVSSRNRFGKQPLHFAVSEECVRLLLEKGAEIDVQGEIGYTPLMSACRHKNLVVARFLISLGADINVKTVNGVSPLALAVGHDLAALVRDMVVAGVKNINTPVFGHFKNMLELALCLEASPIICDVIHAAGVYVRPSFCEESLELCPDDYLNIPHCLGVYKQYASMNLHETSWAEFLKTISAKYDLDKYRSPLSLQARCEQFLRHHLNHDVCRIKSLSLPETIVDGILIYAKSFQ